MEFMDAADKKHISFDDTTSYSDAERNKEKYRSVVKRLEKKIKSCENAITYAKDFEDGLHQTFISEENSAKGEWKEEFDTRELIWSDGVNEIISKMEQTLNLAREKKAEAEEFGEQWADCESNEEFITKQQVSIGSREQKSKEKRRMNEEFRCDSSKMEEMKNKLELIQEILEAALTQAESFHREIEAGIYWKGKSQQAMSEFLYHVIHYHGDIVRGDEPIVKACESITELLDNLEKFSDSWSAWERIGQIV